MLIDDVVAGLNARPWTASLTASLGPRVGDVVAPTLRPVVGATLLDVSSSRTIGGSKVGGLPDVDDRFVWPTEEDDDAPLALVVQLNLADLAAADVSGTLPAVGMLYLFSIYDNDRAYGYEIDDSTTKVLHVPDPGRLSPAHRPDELDDDGVLEERPLHIAPSLLPEDPSLNSAARFDYEVESALDEELIVAGGAPCDVIRLLGRPHLFRDELRELVGEQTALLLRVNGYAVARHAFGEGEFQLVIDPTDLAAGRLDAASVIFQPGT